MNVIHNTCNIKLFPLLHQLDHKDSTDSNIYLITVMKDPIRWSPLSDVVDGYSPTLPHLKGLQNGDTATSAIKQVLQMYLCF